MYEPIYGNYIGMVINDQDPENRSRLQIFIPNLSNTLYSGWNDQLENISFKSFETQEKGGFTKDIASRLYNILPWSEAAVPPFGGGTSGIVHNDIGAAIVNPQGNALQAQQKTPTPVTVDPNPLLKQGITAIPATADANGNYSNISKKINLQSYIDNANASGTLVKAGIDIDLNGSVNSVSLEGAGKAGGNPNTSMTLDGKPLNGVTQIFVAGPEELLGYPVVLQNADTGTTIVGVVGDANGSHVDPNKNINSSLINSNHGKIEMSNAASVGIDAGSFAMSNNGTAVAQGNSNVIATVVTDGSIPRLPVHASSTDYNAIYGNQINPVLQAQIDAMDVSNPTTKITSTGQCVAGFSPNRSLIMQGVASFIKQGGPNGIFSKPSIGAKVWVFFYGGDVQRPVYFASTVEAAASQVAYQV